MDGEQDKIFGKNVQNLSIMGFERSNPTIPYWSKLHFKSNRNQNRLLLWMTVLSWTSLKFSRCSQCSVKGHTSLSSYSLHYITSAFWCILFTISLAISTSAYLASQHRRVSACFLCQWKTFTMVMIFQQKRLQNQCNTCVSWCYRNPSESIPLAGGTALEQQCGNKYTSLSPA